MKKLISLFKTLPSSIIPRPSSLVSRLSSLVCRLSFIFCLLFCVFCLFQPKPAYAAASLTVVGAAGDDWAIGTLTAEGTDSTSGDYWTITNDSGSIEDFEIKVEVTSGNWTACTDCVAGENNNGYNEFVLREDDANGKLIIGTNTPLATGVTNTGTYGLDLWFKAPPPSSTEETETLTVTVMATNWATVLTWPDPGNPAGNHNEAQCQALSGYMEVYDTGATGTICHIASASTPSGWSPAADWQKYSSSLFEGDYCSRHTGSAPVSFSNSQAVKPCSTGGQLCSGTGPGCGYCEAYWCEAWAAYSGYVEGFALSNAYNPSTNRVEIGIY